MAFSEENDMHLLFQIFMTKSRRIKAAGERFSDAFQIRVLPVVRSSFKASGRKPIIVNPQAGTCGG